MKTPTLTNQKSILKLLILLVLCVACNKEDTVVIKQDNSYIEYHKVKARQNATVPLWEIYTAKTIDKLPNFNITNDPETDVYGGWKTTAFAATGFFRVEKINNRWWIIDPLGYPFIHKGIAVLTPGTSNGQKAALSSKYGSQQNWIEQETNYLKQLGFNGAGAWSHSDLIRNSSAPLPYTVIVSPMGAYKSQHLKNYGGTYEQAGWQGYRYDLVMVFDPEFDTYIESSISVISKYKTDKNLVGYYTDNELPWKNDALDRHLKYLSPVEAGYIAAKKWLDERKGKNATLSDINDTDRIEFLGYYFETYMKKVTDGLKKYDPNHMYLGCRFNQEAEELSNAKIFEIAGKYMDIVSINHYRKWEPIQTQMANWERWSGKPFIITEWYTKGEDSGLPNNTGAGWNVPTQQDRGYFYQNFTIELLKSKVCVGWHWFKYQDNDPLDLTTDPSNRDSNKGIINSNYEYYTPLIENMEAINNHAFQLIEYLDSM
jgi:hypothetical protein